MKKGNRQKSKVFFSVNADINKQFEDYCSINFINKSKIIEAFMSTLLSNPSAMNDILKNK